jgi:hypothetical protein
LRERPTSFGPSPIGKRTFVGEDHVVADSLMALPLISSETPFE